MPHLFMNGIHLTVAEGTVLEFQVEDLGSKFVQFSIGGVVFQIDERAVLPDSYFARSLSCPMDGNVHTIKHFESPYLFPLVFDFMVRKFKNRSARLRIVPLTEEQSRELDAIEDFVFPDLTGPKLALCRTTGAAQVALLPPYRSYGLDWFPIGPAERFVFHDNVDICTDARFVKLVLDCNSGKALDTAMCARLAKKYGIRDGIDARLLRHCTVVDIERGRPFAIQASGGGNESVLRVAMQDETEWIVG